MSLSEPNGAVRPGRVKTLPKGDVKFDDVVTRLRAGAPAQAFARVTEVLLERFGDLKGEMGAAVILKLAIETHRHSLFCEVAQDKARTSHDEAAYDKFQEYLNGTSDIPVASGLPMSAGAATAKLDTDVEATDGQEDK